jgi:hypothetical protein
VRALGKESRHHKLQSRKSSVPGGEVLVVRYVSWEGVGGFGERLDVCGVPWRYVDLFAGRSLPDLRLARALLDMVTPATST